MATYKEIYGRYLKVLASDPTGTGAEGQIWYNSTSGNFKSLLSSTAWSSSSQMLTPRTYIGSTGTQTAALAWGGYLDPSPYTNLTEEYNGSGWTAGGNLTAISERQAGFGTQTAAVSAGGSGPNPSPVLVLSAVDEYNGASWTAATALPTATNGAAGAGILTAGLFIGGIGLAPSTTSLTTTFEYDGESWTGGGALNTGRGSTGAAGTQTAGLSFGGTTSPASPAAVNNTESYNGASWTAEPVMSVARNELGGSGTGTSALGYGGEIAGDTVQAVTESYDGTSWTVAPTMATARDRVGGAGASNASALVFAGTTGSTTGVTEEFNKSITVTTPASWAAGGSLSGNFFGRNFTSQGTQNAGNINGGYAPYNGSTEEYNGASWTAGGTSANYRYSGTGGGTQTAGLAMGGGVPPSAGGGATNLCEEYNGASWTAGGNMPAPAANQVGGGTQTAGIAAGGTGPLVATNFYNGASWSAQPGNMNDGLRERTGCGTQSSFIAFGGANPGETAMSADTEEWDGTTWTQTGDLLIALKSMACIGHTATGAVANGGSTQPAQAVSTTQIFNGTSIETGVPNSHANYNNNGNQGCGTSALGFKAACYVPASGTEEYVGETSAVNYRTLTTS